MKFKVKRDVIIDKLQPVAKVINSRHNIPVLTGVLLEVDFENVLLTGSDGEQTLQVCITRNPENPEFTVERPGKCVFPSKYFLELVKKLSEEIEIEITGGLQAEIRSGRTNVHLQVLSADDYPSLPRLNENFVDTFKAGELHKAFQKTMEFVGGESRPILQGVNLQILNDKIIFCSTDSHRLAKYVMTRTSQDDNGSLSIVVPTKRLDVLTQFGDNDVKVIFDTKTIGIISDGYKFYTRLLEGTYPDTSRVIPKQYVAEYVLHREELCKAVDRALLFARELKNFSVRLMFQGQEVTLKVESEVGSVQESIFAETYTGNQLTVGLNAKYLLEGLRTFDGPKIKVGLTGQTSPIVLSEPELPENIHLILPLRLGN